eukprot:TRINITY_DN71219_c0_g1_i1.p1 TRINITY_DN71219_c0_g1~~TRINITY_DN71219_c0_g1_i1.p1  ORF type:complete len:814 (-),score=177.49 TRINITY_DN71219_c0_g1_i1:100-2427(-)
MALPPPPATLPPHPQLPPVTCSEFLKAVMEKQREMACLLRCPASAVPTDLVAKVAAVKAELDHLSASIGGVLEGRPVGFDGAQAFAPELAHMGVPEACAGMGAAHHMQAWPVLEALPAAAYPAGMNPVDATAQAFGMEGVAGHPHGQAPAPQVVEDSQGPAVFKGFQPPPSFAWAQQAPVPSSADVAAAQGGDAAAAPEGASAEVPLAPPLEVLPPRPIRLNPEVEAEGRGEVSNALAAVADELRRCQEACGALRAERRAAVPAGEAVAWCGAVAEQLQRAGNTLEEKLKAFSQRSRAKETAILKLHAKVRTAEAELAEKLARQREAQQQQQQRLASTPCASSERLQPCAAAAAAAIGGQGAPPHVNVGGGHTSPRSPSMQSAGGRSGRSTRGDDPEDHRRTPPVTARSRPAAPRLSTGARGSDREQQRSGAGQQAALAGTVSQASGHGHSAAGVSAGAVRPGGALGGAGGATSPTLGPARRRSAIPSAGACAGASSTVDLEEQLRQKDAEVEQLTKNLHALQQNRDLQLSFWKRELQSKGIQQAAAAAATLQHHSGGPAAPGMGGGQGAAMSSQAGNRTARRPTHPQASSPQPGGGVFPAASREGVPAAVAARGFGADTPRHAHGHHQHHEGGEVQGRGRPSAASASAASMATSTWPLPRKEPRDRSLGTLPRSPRAKPREVAASATSVQQLASAAARRRTPPPPATIRSTSAEERRSRAARQKEADAVACVAAAAQAAQRLREAGGGGNAAVASAAAAAISSARLQQSQQFRR